MTLGNFCLFNPWPNVIFWLIHKAVFSVVLNCRAHGHGGRWSITCRRAANHRGGYDCWGVSATRGIICKLKQIRCKYSWELWFFCYPLKCVHHLLKIKNMYAMKKRCLLKEKGVLIFMNFKWIDVTFITNVWWIVLQLIISYLSLDLSLNVASS